MIVLHDNFMQYSCVAFLDVLGFSAMVEKDAQAKSPVYLEFFRDVFAKIKEHALPEQDLRMFSDSIIVSSPLSVANVIAVMQTVSDLQILFLKNSILVRGGVAMGRHYGDDRVIYSEGLIVAYRLESSRAKYPRVLVDLNLWDWASNFRGLTEKQNRQLNNLVIRDQDGQMFIDFLRNANFQELTPKVREYIEKADRKDTNILEKIQWCRDYHDFAAQSTGNPILDGLSLPKRFSREL